MHNLQLFYRSYILKSFSISYKRDYPLLLLYKIYVSSFFLNINFIWIAFIQILYELYLYTFGDYKNVTVYKGLIYTTYTLTSNALYGQRKHPTLCLCP